MKYSLPILALAAWASAQGTGGYYEDELSQVCMPTNSSQLPDLNAPCNAVAIIEVQCVYGPSALNTLYGQNAKRALNHLARRQDKTSPNPYNGPADTGDDGNLPELSNSTQRDCTCQSQFFDQVSGCLDCYVAHGGSAEDDVGVTPDQIKSISSSYCAASNTPTLGLAEYLYKIASQLPSSTGSASSSQTHDPLGNRTAVSLYFTPSVTGSAAYIIADATNTAKTSTDKSGQIVPTMSANNAAAQSGSSSSSGLAAAKTQAAAAAGLIGIAGLAVFL